MNTAAKNAAVPAADALTLNHDNTRAGCECHCKDPLENDGEDADTASADSSREGRDTTTNVNFRSRSPETEMASLVSRALVGDLKQLIPSADDGAAKEGHTIALLSSKEKQRNCCVCGLPAIYTCPSCGRRTCSVACVHAHKTDHGCSGERDVTKKIPLSEFNDVQLQRDYRFLEDCRRVMSNADRQLPRARRFNFKVLPPPLRALREAARRRGVVCQLMSEGMSKREANTSRYDRPTNTIIWRCDFVFHMRNGETSLVTTNWGNERHRLGDILRYSWSTNPPLPCFHINQTYNRSRPCVGASVKQASVLCTEPPSSDAVKADGEEDGVPERPVWDKEDDEDEAPDHATDSDQEGGSNETDGEDRCHEQPIIEEHPSPESSAEGEAVSVARSKEEEADAVEHAKESAHAEVKHVKEGVIVAGAPAAALLEIVPITPTEVRDQARVREFLEADDEWCILSKGERLGSSTAYFVLDPDKTLNENMRLLFFVNEYPVFSVIHTNDLAQFPLVTEADKEAIRLSFRAKERTPEELLRRQHPGLRLKCDLDPEEAARLSKVPCRMNLLNRCVAGTNCPYWHCTVDEWPQCRSFQKVGRCSMGYRCSFRHGDLLPGEERPSADDGVNDGKRPRDCSRGRGRGRGCGLGTSRPGGGYGRGFRGRGRRF